RHDGAPTSIPYRGQKRWHMVLGLVFGLGAVTWAFSGMLSMDPFPSRTGGAGRPPGPSIDQALRGRVDMAAFAARHPREALQQLAGLQVKELELTSFDGEPVYLATLAGGRTRIVPVRGEPRDEFDHERIVEVVKAAAPDPQAVEARVIHEYDWYYLDRHGRRPLPVILVLMNDSERARYYIDPRTGRIAGSYSSRNWVNRWLYTGLHSLNFPFLYKHRPLWDIVVITFMLGGTALCVTSLVLAWRVLEKKAAALAPGRAASAPPRLREDVA
ncbi:MAG TPA: PepSY domain-containing protein, partial [Vicinamibacterales bacterium]|nr:PepSY domain-containing protein [Vicinamibacterales bacterium]